MIKAREKKNRLLLLIKFLKKKRRPSAASHSRFLKDSSQTAAEQQEELLGEEDPGDLLHRGASLTSEVQDGGSQEGDAQAEAEEHAPVGEGLLQVLLEQRPELLLHQLHVAPSQEAQLHSHVLLLKRCLVKCSNCQQTE